MARFRLGLFGGTFDPPHIGHLLVAQDVVEHLALDRLLFIPAGFPPHKTGKVISPAPLRVEMVQALTSGSEVFRVSEVELSRVGPSYSVDTLRYFKDLHPDADIFFILGADQAAAFDTWQSPDEVASLATLVVMAREGLEVPQGTFTAVPVTRVDISATDIRDRIRDGRTIQYLVPDSVRQIIEKHRLYRAVS